MFLKQQSLSRKMLLLALASPFLWTSTAFGQATIPAPSDHELHPVWGGQNQEVHTMNTASGQRILVGTGGGAIRVSDPAVSGGAWQYANTPTDYTGTIIDIRFLDESTGFAAGRNGQVLKTTNGGQDWTEYGNPVLDPCGDLASLWTIQPFTEDVAMVGGLWSFQYTVDGGTTWATLEIHGFNSGGPNEYDGPAIPVNEFQFYSMEAVGSLGQFRAAVSGEWELPSGNVGVVLFTDASDPNSIGGRKWQMVLDDSQLTQADAAPGEILDPNGSMKEPWAVAFERGSSASSAVGYVVGGEAANSPGRIYFTDDGGKTWAHEKEIDVTAYSVAVESAEVLVGAYSGQVWTKSSTEPWTSNVAGNPLHPPLPGPSTGNPIMANVTTVALHAVSGAGPGQYVIAGGWGLTMRTDDFGQNWKEANPYYNLDIYEQRLQGLHAFANAPDTAFVVGQLGGIMKTVDGGANWDVSLTEGSPGGRALAEVEFRESDSNNGIAVGNNGAIFYTLDGGATWLAGNVAVGSAAGYNLRDVFLLGNGEAWAVGTAAGAVPGIFYTRTKGQTWFQLTAPQNSDLNLTGVVFPEQTRGIVIGWSGSSPGGSSARAFSVDFDPASGAMTWTDVSPPHPPANPLAPNPVSRKLLGIDCHGSDILTATIYATGNGGMVLDWNGASFDDLPALYDMNASGGVISRMLKTDLQSVDISPSGNAALIGAQYSINLGHAADLGWMLKLNAGAWSKVKSNTSKNILSISLTSDVEGFVLGQTLNNPEQGMGERIHNCDGYSDDDVKSGSFNNPNLADSIILKFLSN